MLASSMATTMATSSQVQAAEKELQEGAEKFQNLQRGTFLALCLGRKWFAIVLCIPSYDGDFSRPR